MYRLSAKQSKFASGIRYYERAIQLAEDCFGVDSEDLIPIYQGIGRVQMLNGQQEEAITNYLQVKNALK